MRNKYDELLYRIREVLKRAEFALEDLSREKEFVPEHERRHMKYYFHELRDQMYHLIHLSDELRREREEEEKILRQATKSDISTLISPWKEAQDSTQKELHAFLAVQSLGIEPGGVSLHRFVPVRLYLSSADDEQIWEVTEAINSFVSAFGFDVSDEFPAEEGSWWKRWYIRTKETITRSKLSAILKDIEQALRLRFIDGPQSEVDNRYAQVVESLAKATENSKDVMAQVGPVLYVKEEDPQGESHVRILHLNRRQLTSLERNPNELRSYKKTVAKLSHLDKGNDSRILPPDED